MAQTESGKTKRVLTMKQKYGSDYFKRIGALGGNTRTDKKRGFAARPDIASAAGKKGGAISKSPGHKQSQETRRKISDTKKANYAQKKQMD